MQVKKKNTTYFHKNIQKSLILNEHLELDKVNISHATKVDFMHYRHHKNILKIHL